MFFGFFIFGFTMKLCFLRNYGANAANSSIPRACREGRDSGDVRIVYILIAVPIKSIAYLLYQEASLWILILKLQIQE